MLSSRYIPRRLFGRIHSAATFIEKSDYVELSTLISVSIPHIFWLADPIFLITRIILLGRVFVSRSRRTIRTLVIYSSSSPVHLPYYSTTSHPH